MWPTFMLLTGKEVKRCLMMGFLWHVTVAGILYRLSVHLRRVGHRRAKKPVLLCVHALEVAACLFVLLIRIEHAGPKFEVFPIS